MPSTYSTYESYLKKKLCCCKYTCQTCLNDDSSYLNHIIGPIGATGPAGPTGPTGPTGGATGSSENFGIGKEGPQGPQGPEGKEGPQGPQGPEGKEGPQGPEGKEGPQGPEGKEGPQGPQGPEGKEGPQGPEGKEGPQGPEGKEGPQGPEGKEGKEGIQGPEGKEGKEGRSLSVSGNTLSKKGSTHSIYYRKLKDSPGPIVTIQTGATVIVSISALAGINDYIDADDEVIECWMSFIVVGQSGDVYIRASDANGIKFNISKSKQSETISRIMKITGLVPGLNKFIAKYKKVGRRGSVTFENRDLIIFP
jgi:hypothetical protein